MGRDAVTLLLFHGSKHLGDTLLLGRGDVSNEVYMRRRGVVDHVYAVPHLCSPRKPLKVKSFVVVSKRSNCLPWQQHACCPTSEAPFATGDRSVKRHQALPEVAHPGLSSEAPYHLFEVVGEESGARVRVHVGREHPSLGPGLCTQLGNEVCLDIQGSTISRRKSGSR